MEAAYTGNADTVSLLLAAGADIEAKNIVSKRISILDIIIKSTLCNMTLSCTISYHHI